MTLCTICRAPWHPASGMLVGSPQQHPMCGRCWRESVRCAQWATGRRPKRGQPDFYAHALPVAEK